MRLFLDTNIMIDDVGKLGEDGKIANLLQLPQVFGDAELIVSAQSYTDAFYVLKKYIDATLLQNKLLDTLGFYQVCALDSDDIKAACQRGLKDFRDALIAVAAEKSGADYIITRDASFQCGRVPLLTPQGFFDMMLDRGVTYTIADPELEQNNER